MGSQKRTEKFYKKMGNLCSGNTKVEDVEEPQSGEQTGEEGERNTVAGRRPTKGAGLLGKTEWTDDEEEEEGAVNTEAPEAKEAEPSAVADDAAAECAAPEPAEPEIESETPEVNENVEISDEAIQEATTTQPDLAETGPQEDQEEAAAENDRERQPEVEAEIRPEA